MPEAASPEPAALVRAETARLRHAARRGPLVDVACGAGRNALPLARLGLRVVALDRARERLATLHATARAEGLPLAAIAADLEAHDAIPLATGSAGAVLVFRYLHRPLAREIERVLRPGGLLLYETFTSRHREVAEHPRNPAFLLGPDELPELFPGFEVIRYEEALVREPGPAAVARLVAARPG